MHIREGDQQAVEYSSSSALLHLSHRLYLCTYYGSVYIIIDIIKPEPQLKRGICPFISCVVTWSGSVLKRPPVYPLKFAFQKSFVISLGALVVSEPMRHLLIGESHQITWGHGQV